jgi:hypothetical protein
MEVGGHFLLESLWRHPRIGAVGFLVLAAFGAYFSLRAWNDDRKTPDDPVPMTLQEAITRSQKDTLWVALQNVEDFEWDCSSIVHKRYKGSEWMDVVTTDPAQSVVMVVTLPDLLTCDELLDRRPALTGQLTHLKKSDYKSYDDEGQLSKYQQATAFLKLCTYCDPNRSETVIVVGILLMLVGLVPGVLCLYRGFFK